MPPLSIAYIREKWQHAGFQKYFRNMGWAFGARGFSLVMSFFVGTYVARYLGPQRYGVLNYVLSFVTIFAFLASFGIDSILVRDLIKYKDKEKEVLNTAFTLKLIGGISVVLISIISSILIKNDIYTTLLIFIYSIQLLLGAFNVTDYYFQSIVKYKYSSIAQVISTIAVSLLKLFLVYKGFGTGWFIFALIFEGIVSTVILLRFFLREGQRVRFSLNKDIGKKMIADSWPFILSSAFYLIYTKIDQVMIGKMIDTTSLGIYAAGVKIAEIWYFIPAIICGVMLPAIINAKVKDHTLYKTRIKKLFLLIIGLSFIIALFEFVFAKYLILMLFGKAYTGSIVILQIYTWAGIIVSAVMVAQQYLITENKTKVIMGSSFFGALINVMLNLILIPKFGIMGSAWATVISYSTIPVIIFISLKVKKLN